MGLQVFGASYLGLRSSDLLQPRLSNYGPSALNLLRLALQISLAARHCYRMRFISFRPKAMPGVSTYLKVKNARLYAKGIISTKQIKKR